MENWSKCPRCESNRVQKVSKVAASIAFFASGGMFIWIGLLIPFLWILVPVCFALAVLVLFGKSTWQCQDCKHTWKIEKVKNINNVPLK